MTDNIECRGRVLVAVSDELGSHAGEKPLSCRFHTAVDEAALPLLIFADKVSEGVKGALFEK